MAIAYNLQPNFVWNFNTLAGLPASGGEIYTWQSANHSIPKPVFTDSDGMVPWTNPITLDASGKQDYNGTFYPIYFADDVPYFIQVVDADGNTIAEIDGFPSANGGAPVITQIDIENYITNGQFFFDYGRNFGDGQHGFETLPTGDFIFAPGEWHFSKNNDSATDQLLITDVNPGAINPPNNPKALLNYVCNDPGSGETLKRIYFKFRSVRMFSGEDLNLQFSASTSLVNSLTISITQNFGTGGSAPIETAVSTILLPSNSVNQEVNIPVPSISGNEIGPNGDDYFSVNFDLPLNGVSNISLTNFCLRIGEEFVSFQEESVNITKVEAIGEQYPLSQSVNSDDGNFYPVLRKGQKNLSLQSLAGTIVEKGYAYSLGWDGLECNGESIFSANYYALANNISTNWGSGGSGFYSSSPNGVTLSGTATGAVAAPQDVNTHMKVYQSIVGAVDISNVTQIICTEGAQIPNSSYFFVSTTVTNFYVWFNLNGTGVDPSPAGRTGIAIAYTGTETSASIAALIVAAAITGITANVPTNTITAINTVVGVVTSATAATSGMIITQSNPGSVTEQAQVSIETIAGSAIDEGTYFTINGVGQQYYVWFSLKNNSTNPGSTVDALDGLVGIKVIYTGVETAPQIAALIAYQLFCAQVLIPGAQGLFTRTVANGSTNDPDRLTRTALTIGANAGNNVGSYQADQNQSHNHTHPSSNGGNNASPTYIVQTSTNNNVNTMPMSYSGGNQANPKNIYTDKVILY